MNHGTDLFIEKSDKFQMPVSKNSGQSELNKVQLKIKNNAAIQDRMHLLAGKFDADYWTRWLAVLNDCKKIMICSLLR